MPQFILDKGSPDDAVKFDKLPAFVRGYIEAMFFTADTDATVTRQPFNDEVLAVTEDLTQASFGELAPETLARIEIDCAKFQSGAVRWLNDAYSCDYSHEQAGHDFWLTRNGHGAGYWCRDELGPECGERLTNAAQAYGERYLYRGADGKLYFM